MLKKILITSLAVLMLASCGTVDNLRDGLANAIETEERATRPDRVRVETQFIGIPEELYNPTACPPPVRLTPEEIARIETEQEYNERFVAPLYANNERCYLGMRRIERFTENNTTEPQSNEKSPEAPKR